MTDDFDQMIFEDEQDKSEPPNSIQKMLVDSVRGVMDAMTPAMNYVPFRFERVAKKFSLSSPMLEQELNLFLTDGWDIGFWQNWEGFLLIVFSRRIENPPNP